MWQDEVSHLSMLDQKIRWKERGNEGKRKRKEKRAEEKRSEKLIFSLEFPAIGPLAFVRARG